MKKVLLLTSCGLSNQMKKLLFDICGRKPEDMRILLIPTAGIESDEAREGLAVCLDECEKMGICYENIFVYNLELIPSKEYTRTYSAYIPKPAMISRLLTSEEMIKFDAVFITGGDLNVLCRETRRTGFDTVLKNAVNTGLVYVGISAGSMFGAGNSEYGLRVIPNRIIPHWNGDKLSEFRPDDGDIFLSDGHAVYINDDEISII